VALLAGLAVATAIGLGTLAVFHLTLTLAFAAFVLHHLLLGLVLLVKFAHGLILTSPSTTRPIVGRQFIGRSLDATGSSAVGRLTGRRRLLNGHIGITKSDHF